MVSVWAAVKLSTAAAVFLIFGTLSPAEADTAPLGAEHPQQHLAFGEEPRVRRQSDLAPSEPQDEVFGPMNKKAPRGFLGMRGKKSSPEFVDHALKDGYSLQVDSYDYNSELNPTEEDLYEAMELLKRTPSGFIGMRGKKAPSGFVGMRGKKAPRGFLGMRGKKAAPRGFLGMRGKKTPRGFLGMRGKKDYPDYEDLESLYEVLRSEDKRAPRGFLGMRGKKDFEESQVDSAPFTENRSESSTQNDDVIPETLSKRGPSGFIGMRG